jgi:hypothetical protein
MSEMFNEFFDYWTVKIDCPPVVFIGKNFIGSILFYPSKRNLFIENNSYVRIYDNGELSCDEDIAKLITYTDAPNEFMDFCLNIWKNKTNKKLYPNCIVIANGDYHRYNTLIPYRDGRITNYLVE